jgi:hypothetical protein
MLAQLQELCAKYPKHWTRMISKDAELTEYLIQATDHCDPNTDIKNRTMIVLHGDPECANGHIRSQGDIFNGWKFCGKAGTCACARQQVSEKVQASKQLHTSEEKAAIEQKKQQTLLKKYGVTNAGQTQRARSAHSDFYAVEQNVAAQTAKQQATLLARYGVTNAQQMASTQQKTAETCQAKWGVNNPMQNPAIAQLSSQTRKINWDPAKMFEQNFTHFCDQAQSRWGVTPLITADQYTGVAARPEIAFRCDTCGHEFSKRFDYACPPVCRVCHPVQTTYLSKQEQSVADWIRANYAGPVIQSDRSIINPWQLDIVLPDLKVAIEYCGLYWHSELSSGKHWQYHAEKTRLCEQKGYRLITMFSDEWLQKHDQTCSKLHSILGVQTQKVHARRCSVEQIDRTTAESFHNLYHIQGSPSRLGVNLALMHNNQPVMMSSWVRKNTNQWELVRLSSSVRVVGGAGRLLANFVKLFQPQIIVSFSDNRWSQGQMYAQLGFKLQSHVPPMQHYVQNYQTRFHKLAFAKSKIVQPDESVTEWQRMQQMGFDRIWDCGKKKWVWTA